MDQIKIGIFIAENRHTLGLTQAQLGEKLGVSDKSVSKWERGVCLPDPSLYFPLCDLLDVTVNELFAGERLPEPEKALESSAQTIVTMAADSTRKDKRLLRVRIAFWSALVALAVVLHLALRRNSPMRSALEAVSVRDVLNWVYITLLIFLFFSACYFLMWLIYGRGKKGRVEDKAAGGFLEKMAFLRAGNRPDINGPRAR